MRFHRRNERVIVFRVKKKVTPEIRKYAPVLLEAWREGVEEFNRGQYWEAHEKWERGWKGLPEPERTWVQAWIQLAGVLCLRQKNRETAARALSVSALAKLEQASQMRMVLPRIDVEGGEVFLKQNLDKKSRVRLKAMLLLPAAL